MTEGVTRLPRRCAYTFAQDHFKCPSRGSRDRITQRPRRSALGREGIVAVPLKTWRRDEAVGKGPLDSNTYPHSSPHPRPHPAAHFLGSQPFSSQISRLSVQACADVLGT